MRRCGDAAADGARARVPQPVARSALAHPSLPFSPPSAPRGIHYCRLRSCLFLWSAVSAGIVCISRRPRMRSGRWAVGRCDGLCAGAELSGGRLGPGRRLSRTPLNGPCRRRSRRSRKLPGATSRSASTDCARPTLCPHRRTRQRYVVPLQPDMSVLPLLNRQPDSRLRPWDYLAQLVDAERVADGRGRYRRWQDVLQRIRSKYGVDPAMVVGVWGIENNFGQNVGGRPLVQSLATLSCYGRRQTYFRTEFANALRILQDGDIPASQLNGSWGRCLRGRRSSCPAPSCARRSTLTEMAGAASWAAMPGALASTARFLQQAGWRTGEPRATRCSCHPASAPAAPGAATGRMWACGLRRA